MKTLVMTLCLLFVFVLSGIPLAAQTIQHEVQSGETLYGIARRYQIGIADVQRFNAIASPNTLLPGMILTIPGTYRVERGDTLFGLARRFEVSVDEIRRLNELQGSAIAVGQILRLPIPAANTEGLAAPATRTLTRTPTLDGDFTEIAGGNPTTPATPVTTPTPLPVAVTIQRPIDFSAGGMWPVAGDAQTMDGKLPGVLIRGERGSAVYAVTSGRVVYAGPHTTFGRVVFIQTNQGYIYVYGGHDSVLVGVGDIVNAGSTIGTLGLSPAEQGPALYFSVWRDNEFIDPGSAPRG